MTRLLFIIATLMAAPAYADVYGLPHIVDGDTLEVAGQKVRLLDTDAPEARQTCADLYGNRYNCGTAAAAYLRRLIGSKPVRCIVSSKQDRYGRLPALCFVGREDLGEGDGPGRSRGAVQVRQGHI